MSSDNSERLLEYALGELSAAEAEQVEEATRSNPALAEALRAISEGLDALTADPPGPSVGPSGRQRLMDAISGTNRFMPFVDELADLFDMTVDAVMEVLSATQRVTEWASVGVPGVRAHHFQAGPRLAGADTGLVFFEAGARFPHHVHHGRELTYVLQGTFHFSTGEVLRPGDRILLDGSEHEVWAGESEDVIYAVFHHGLTVKGSS